MQNGFETSGKLYPANLVEERQDLECLWAGSRAKNSSELALPAPLATIMFTFHTAALAPKTPSEIDKGEESRNKNRYTLYKVKQNHPRAPYNS